MSAHYSLSDIVMNPLFPEGIGFLHHRRLIIKGHHARLVTSCIGLGYMVPVANGILLKDVANIIIQNVGYFYF